MCKIKHSIDSSLFGMPKAPWIYINDPTPGSVHARELATLIPDVLHLSVERTGSVSLKAIPKENESVILIADSKSDHDNCQKVKNVNLLKKGAIAAGNNFVSVNVMNDLSKVSDIDNFGPNHLNIVDGLHAASKIYKWLFTVLTVRETLHLIPEEQMRKTDDKLFPEYAYCPVNESKSRAKDARIQFVALVLSQPQVVRGKKLTWSVADRTGVANFYFQWRGSASQYTWDWVLSLKPGDRKALPRMPMVEVKEKKRVQLAKAPFRATAAVVGGTGVAIKALGRGFCKVGTTLKMGSRSKWVPEADIGDDGKKTDWSPVREGSVKVISNREKKTINVFNEKGERNWSDCDGASVASTDVESDFDEKCSKEFL